MADSWHQQADALAWSPKVLVNGAFHDSRSDGTFVVTGPRDGRAIAEIPNGSAADVGTAVRSARTAFNDGRWSALSARDRGEIMMRFGDVIEANAAELALRVSVEMGKPIRDALTVELSAVAQCIRWYGQLVDKQPDEAPSATRDALALVTREPVGVVGAVVPWNFPLTMTAWKLGPALAAGNSVVLKPAEQTSLSALRLGELALEAGLPVGVLNVVPGRGEIVGEALGRHPDVDVIAFTGSVGVGRRFLGYAAASNGKRVWPELGGKSGSVILSDADVALAGSTTAWGCFYNQGQMCSASSRMIVTKDVADEAIRAAVSRAETMQPADPLDWETTMGPVVSEAQLEKIIGFVERAVSDGATAVTGGAQRFPAAGGSYFAPTVLTGVRPEMEIAQHEVFGPVLSVLEVDSADEAVRVANDTRFGLAAALWTNDLSSAHRLSRRLKAGTVWVNCFEEGDMSMPFGGTGASGFGRDKSAHALDKYTDLKSTWIELTPR